MWYLCRTKFFYIATVAFNCFSLSSAAVASDMEHTVDELAYGVALYDFYQGNYFSSITDILVAKENKMIIDENKSAELLLGSLYLSYGMQEQAHKIFNDIAINETREIPKNILDQAWFHIGKEHYITGNEEDSKQALLSIDSDQRSTLDSVHESERLNILSDIYIHNHQYDDALQMLTLFPEGSTWKEYTQFNLGVDLIKNDQPDDGMSLLEDLAKSRSSNIELGILHDQANLALAATYAKLGKPESSIKYFENIKLRNPQSNSALLGLGWVKFKAASYDDALSVWLELAGRSKSDTDVQEALMLIPYTLEKRGEKLKALGQYDFAVETYVQQLKNVENIKAFIEQGEVINMLKTSAVSEASLNSREVITMMGPELSDYLFKLIASNEFKQAVNSYRELAVLTNSLTKWEQTIPSLNLVLDEKINTYKNRLTVVIDSLKFDYAKKLQNRRAELVKKLDKVLASNATKILVNKEEKELLAVLDKVKANLDSINGNDPEVIELKSKYHFLAGLLKWNIDTDYAPRLWTVKTSIRELDKALLGVNRAIESLTRVWKTAPADHQRLRAAINGKKEQIKTLKLKIKQAMSVQEKKVHMLAENAIEQYRNYLKKYHDRALFGKARVYDSMVLKN
jgi:tetratricopeptide (TPR) repeat protein